MIMLLHYVRFSDLIKDYAEEKDQKYANVGNDGCHIYFGALIHRHNCFGNNTTEHSASQDAYNQPGKAANTCCETFTVSDNCSNNYKGKN